jgi:hypothetical protein
MLPQTKRLPPRRPSSPALWGALIALSVLVGAGLHEIGLPAAFMLGPLMAAILVQTTCGGVKVPLMLQVGAQAIIGCLIARGVSPAVVSGFLSYLAASPGGVDAAAIIAASTKVDMPLVTVVQTVRLVVVLAIGPPLARWVAKTLASPAPVLAPERLDIGDLD